MDATEAYLRDAIRSWERLRIVYNLAVGLGVLALWIVVFSRADWQLVPFLIVVLNSLYCLGPLLEIVLYVFLRRPMGRSRNTWFAAGLTATLVLMCCYCAMVS